MRGPSRPALSEWPERCRMGAGCAADPAGQAQRRAALRGSAEALDRRAHLRLDQPLSPAGPRLRAAHPLRRRLHPPRHDPDHAATPHRKAFNLDSYFPERL